MIPIYLGRIIPNIQQITRLFFIAHIPQDNKNDCLENVSPASNMAILGCLR